MRHVFDRFTSDFCLEIEKTVPFETVCGATDET